jgi:AbrB family looped-hinge helix DNA binding protein
METVTVSSKGQIAIPKSVRDRLNLVEGTKLTLEVRGPEIILSKEPAWRKLRGSGAGRDLMRSASVKTRVLDSWAILEWISGRQPATDLVGRLLADAEAGQTRLLISAINVGEVYYFLMKHDCQDLAESWRESSRTLPATIELPTADGIWSAASLKGKYAIAYADAFAAALAQKYNCPLVTGDPEVQQVDQLELDWLPLGD